MVTQVQPTAALVEILGRVVLYEERVEILCWHSKETPTVHDIPISRLTPEEFVSHTEERWEIQPTLTSWGNVCGLIQGEIGVDRRCDFILGVPYILLQRGNTYFLRGGI